MKEIFAVYNEHFNLSSSGKTVLGIPKLQHLWDLVEINYPQ